MNMNHGFCPHVYENNLMLSLLRKAARKSELPESDELKAHVRPRHSESISFS